MKTSLFKVGFVAATIRVLAGCGGDNGAKDVPVGPMAGNTSGSAPTSGSATPGMFTLGGTLAGLSAAGLVLTNGGDSVSPNANATTFAFPTHLSAGSAYHVVVASQPTGLTCTLAGAGGTMVTAAVFNVAVTCHGTQWVVTTLAGSTVAGETDGSGTKAMFNGPCGAALGSTGSIYVSDYGGNRIRKVSPTGEVTTLAGSGTAGWADGAGMSAMFNSPCGLAIAKSGNLYVADVLNSLIRKITPAGDVTTVAGAAGVFGYADGVGGAARFDEPYGIAVDAAENLYVTDTDNCAIRKVTPSARVTTIAGGGPAACLWLDGQSVTARFNVPIGIAINASGDLFVADQLNNAIREITPTGLVTTFAGSTFAGTADGVGRAATFASPFGIAVDGKGNVYVTDIAAAPTGPLVRGITPDGTVTTLAGSSSGYADGVGTNAAFSPPTLLAVDDSDSLYVPDYGNNDLRKIFKE